MRKATGAFIFVICFLHVGTTPAAVVILYHHVSDTTPKSTGISPAQFEAHMDYLEKNNSTVVPLLELTEKLRKGEPLPDKTVAITFDDSYASVYDSAYPRLKKRGWPFTFFVNTDAVGTSRLFVTWAQLREMAAQGVTIANHTTSGRRPSNRSTLGVSVITALPMRARRGDFTGTHSNGW